MNCIFILLFYSSSTKNQEDWNSRYKTNCLLQNQCLTPNIAYQADVSNNADNKKRVYLGVCETPF